MNTIEQSQAALIKAQGELIERLMEQNKSLVEAYAMKFNPIYPVPSPSLVGPGQWPPQITCGGSPGSNETGRSISQP